MNNKFIGIIPARYASSRFPGKPLAMLGDKPVIQHVCERVKTVLDDVVVATDDVRIYDTVKLFGGQAVMTRDDHASGSDRVWEAYCNISSEADVIINIQGDEPFVDPKQIQLLIAAFDSPSTEIATLARKYNAADCPEAITNPNNVKVCFDKNHKALYFSRSPIPYVRDIPVDKWSDKSDFYFHIGIYAFKATILKDLTRLPASYLEKAEKLEQLRWLQNGYGIHVSVTDYANIGIDTPEDLEKARKLLSQNLHK